MQRQLDIVSHSEDQTLALAEKLGPHLRDPNVVVLSGVLGSGKTVFVRGLVTALGIDTDLVSSPSFTMVNEYPGQRSVYHLDLYRLQDVSELTELGWDDYISREGLTVIEWGEKAREYLPQKYYLIEFEIVGEQERRITVSLVQQ
ncbi:MAG: tRNA (adenosine(37)-N6)-threonylcarbamoyltransferase complex ATPase subunit type 1 TsaE [Candidatus Zixiibacteriota bacterium]